MTRGQLVLTAVLVAAALGPLMLYGVPLAWAAVERRAKARFEADLRADLARTWAGWYETWCAHCRVFSIERTQTCRFCDRSLIVLKDFGALASAARDEAVMQDQMHTDRRRKLRALQTSRPA